MLVLRFVVPFILAQMLASAAIAQTSSDWPTFGGAAGGGQYSGLAQVNQSYDQCLDDARKKVALDLEYIGRQSLSEDLKIMALTVPVMVFRKGAW